MKTEPTIQNISIEAIIPNRFQPRLSFDEQGLNELSDSIKEHGIIQPIVLRRLGDKYEIIAGERRYKAATLAGLTEVPAIISDLDDNESAEVALIENVQRRDLTSIEEAKSYKKILDRGYLTQEQLAKRLGIAQSTISNKLRLLNLSIEVQEALMNGKISERHARSLLVLVSPEDQKKMLARIINERLTVRQLDAELKKQTSESKNEVRIEENNMDTTTFNLEPTQANISNEQLSTLDVLDFDTLEVNPSTMNATNLENPIMSVSEPAIEELSIETLDIEAPIKLEEEKTTEYEGNQSTKKLFNIFEQAEYPSLEDEAVNLNGIAANFNPFLEIEEEPSKEIEEELVTIPEQVEEIKLEPVQIPKRIEANNMLSITDAFVDLEQEIKEAGFKITTEEFDFEDLYQIIIKIDKTS